MGSPVERGRETQRGEREREVWRRRGRDWQKEYGENRDIEGVKEGERERLGIWIVQQGERERGEGKSWERTIFAVTFFLLLSSLRGRSLKEKKNKRGQKSPPPTHTLDYISFATQHKRLPNPVPGYTRAFMNGLMWSQICGFIIGWRYGFCGLFWTCLRCLKRVKAILKVFAFAKETLQQRRRCQAAVCKVTVVKVYGETFAGGLYCNRLFNTVHYMVILWSHYTADDQINATDTVQVPMGLS